MTSCLVAVCAYTLQRWDQLEGAVTEAAAQAEPGDRVLVVIDHNPELEDRARAAFAPLGVEVVANGRKRGLSGGRNTAIELADGVDVVVYLDDDATPEPGWLDALRRHYDDPAVIAVGGVAHPVWPAGRRRPASLPAAGLVRGELDWVVGCTYAGQPTQADEVRNLMGCNMSFRRDRLVALGGFDEDLGRVGTTPLGCEETELCIRATQAEPGARIVFEPAAVVRHHVSVDRLRWRYLVDRSRAEGLSKAFVARRVTQRAGLSTEAAYTRRVLPRGVARELGKGNLPGAAAIVVALAMAGLGYARGTVALRRRSAEAARGRA